MKTLKALFVNLKIYYLMTFRNVFLVIAHYLLPILFYLLFSVVFVGISPDNKITIIASMTAFAIAMNSYIGLPGSVSCYAVGDIKRAYIAGGISLWRVFICAGISNFIHSLITSLVILFTAGPLFGATFPSSILWFLLALLISIVLATLIGVAIGMFSKSRNVATLLSQVVFLPSLFLSGAMIPLDVLPKFLQYVTYIIPLRHSVTLLGGYDLVALLVSLGFIIVLTILLVIRYKLITKRE